MLSRIKYANYIYSGKHLNNIGDNMQIIAIDYLYSLLGINKNDIVYINKDELSKYHGNKVILPVSMPLVDYVENGIAGRFSNDIIPLFLGLTIVKDELATNEINYLKKYEPIGCRDERTFNTLKKYGINSYLGGCLTLTLPLCNTNKKNKKIYFVDVPKEVDNYVPNEMKKNIVYTTHMYDKPIDPKKTMSNQYDLYKRNAKLVVTSLLHCSMPCLAAGIPVIITKTNISYRFAWIDKFCEIYTPINYNQINWNQKPIYYESFKEKYLKMILNRLEGKTNNNEIEYIHNYFMNRKRNDYVVDAMLSLKQYIDKNWTDFNRPYHYYVWGLTQTTELLISYIRSKYSNAKLIKVIDKYKRIKYENDYTVKPEDIVVNKNDYIFVTSYSANDDAKKTFEESDINNKIAYMNIII